MNPRAGEQGLGWVEWAQAVPVPGYTAVLDAPDDPARAAAHLARSCSAGLGDQYVVYEQAGVWYFATGSAVTLTLDAMQVTARAGQRAWTAATGGRPLEAITEALSALKRTAGGLHVYGWAAFELGHLLHGDPASAGTQPLLHLLVPSLEVAISPGSAKLRAVDDAHDEMVSTLLREASGPEAAGGTTRTMTKPDTERLITAGASAYRTAVAGGVGDIRAGLIDKTVLSRAVPLPAGVRPDLPASYLAGRRANTPARSLLVNLGGVRAAGFSPETVVEVDADGRVSTQPLAGTRALGPDPTENARLRKDLLADPKEVREHTISVRLACEEMEEICRPGSVVVEEFLAVEERGSVQHLASRVSGWLRDGLGPWPAFAALFPSITATGVPKTAALEAVTRHEPGPRGLYGGAVFRAGTDGSLDAALVLRTLFADADRAWLRAGAGVMRESTPEREYEETREKLRSVAPYLHFSGV